MDRPFDSRFAPVHVICSSCRKLLPKGSQVFFGDLDYACGALCIDRLRREGIRSPMQRLHNPLRYWCAPNAATPEYVAERSFLNFLAYGLMVSYVVPHHRSVDVSLQSFCSVREAFLEAVGYGIRHFRRFKPRRKVDWCKAPVKLAHDCLATWKFCWHDLDNASAPDGALLFDYSWTRSEPCSVWLSVEALSNRKDCKAKLEAAAALVRQHKLLLRTTWKDVREV